MKLVGFGCSFTYGSELIDPELDGIWDNESQTRVWDRHYKNEPWRTSHCWLGLLAKHFNCEFENLAEPANSNFAIGQQITEYLRTRTDVHDDIIICIGWTAPNRMSWFDTKWTHNGFADDKHGWELSAKEWVSRNNLDADIMFTRNAKLIANAACKYYEVPLVQFNALGVHHNEPYANYLGGSNTMNDYLRQRQGEFQTKYFAQGEHPNEKGHEVWVELMSEWMKAKKIV